MFRWPERLVMVILAYGLVFVGLPTSASCRTSGLRAPGMVLAGQVALGVYALLLVAGGVIGFVKAAAGRP